MIVYVRARKQVSEKRGGCWCVGEELRYNHQDYMHDINRCVKRYFDYARHVARGQGAGSPAREEMHSGSDDEEDGGGSGVEGDGDVSMEDRHEEIGSEDDNGDESSDDTDSKRDSPNSNNNNNNDNNKNNNNESDDENDDDHDHNHNTHNIPSRNRYNSSINDSNNNIQRNNVHSSPNMAQPDYVNEVAAITTNRETPSPANLEDSEGSGRIEIEVCWEGDPTA